MGRSPAAATIQRIDADHRYELLVDGERAGLAAPLVQQALADMRAFGKRIAPACPCVAAFLGKHDALSHLSHTR
jgi:predicted GNAT family acetyltransferase